MKVNFQIIQSFNDNESLKENILLLLKETFDESTTISTEIEEQPKNIEEWSILNWIEIKYNHPLNGDKYISGFVLDLEEAFKEVIQDFCKKLQDDENIDLVLRYSDEGIQAEHQKYAKEIFDLEMKLREVISFIFLDTYKKDFYNLLNDICLKIQPLSGNNRPDEEYFKKHFENEFFFLLFSDYIRINNLKELKKSDLTEMIINSNEYDDLKQKIQNRGIIKEKYKDFLARIKQNIEPVENLRNCIAHNRSFTDKVIIDYVKVKRNLERAIDEFWDEVKNEN